MHVFIFILYVHAFLPVNVSVYVYVYVYVYIYVYIYLYVCLSTYASQFFTFRTFVSLAKIDVASLHNSSKGIQNILGLI